MPKSWSVGQGDCVDTLRKIPDNTFDSVVTDPPYGLGFMGKEWDHDVPSTEIWKEVFRVLKPGSHLLSFAGTRTYHWMGVNIESVGFEIRDMVSWLTGQGFPKSKNLGNGFGTNLKPAMEPCVLARKPISEKTIAENFAKWGTGGINIDGCRVAIDPVTDASQLRTMNRGQRTEDTSGQEWGLSKKGGDVPQVVRPDGRFPANVIFSHHLACVETDEVVNEPGYVINRFTDGAKPFGGGAGHEFETEKFEGGQRKIWLCHPGCPIRILDGQSGKLTSGTNCIRSKEGNFGAGDARHKLGKAGDVQITYGDTGGASRFFYCSKANKHERNGSNHPTVKPVSLLKYLCRLVTPPNGLILDPFAGTGTTGQAGVEEGFRVVLLEKEAEYVEDIKKRMAPYA